MDRTTLLNGAMLASVAIGGIAGYAKMREDPERVGPFAPNQWGLFAMTLAAAPGMGVLKVGESLAEGGSRLGHSPVLGTGLMIAGAGLIGGAVGVAVGGFHSAFQTAAKGWSESPHQEITPAEWKGAARDMAPLGICMGLGAAVGGTALSLLNRGSAFRGSLTGLGAIGGAYLGAGLATILLVAGGPRPATAP